MVDFRKLRESKAKPRPVHPREIFNALPKPPGINDLYASQAEVLDAWFTRRTDKDVVVKLHTGGGKTLSAMSFAINHAIRNEMDRVIVVIPYTSIIKQNAKRYKEALSVDGSTPDEKIVLEHHSAIDEQRRKKENAK